MSHYRGSEAITEADDLYRRLTHWQVGPDGRATAAAFYMWNRGTKKPLPDPEISVNIARLTGSLNELLTLVDRQDLGAGTLPARVPLDLQLDTFHNPVDGNYGHALILNPGQPVEPRTICQLLAEQVDVLIPPSRPAPRGS